MSFRGEAEESAVVVVLAVACFPLVSLRGASRGLIARGEVEGSATMPLAHRFPDLLRPQSFAWNAFGEPAVSSVFCLPCLSRKLFFAKNLSKIACQALNRPNSYIPKEIKMSISLSPTCYSLNRDKEKGPGTPAWAFSFGIKILAVTPYAAIFWRTHPPLSCCSA